MRTKQPGMKDEPCTLHATEKALWKRAINRVPRTRKGHKHGNSISISGVQVPGQDEDMGKDGLNQQLTSMIE